MYVLGAMNFLPKASFIIFHIFLFIVLSLSFNPKKVFSIFFLIYALTQSSFIHVLFGFHGLLYFLPFNCYWYLFLIQGGHMTCRMLLQFFYICWFLLCVLTCEQFWRKFHGLLRKKIYSLMFRYNVLRHLLNSFDLWYSLTPEFL